MDCWSLVLPAPDITLQIGASAQGLCWLSFSSELPTHLGPRDDSHPLIREAARQLELYFAAKLRSFDLPLDLRGTAFQESVWHKLLQIPYGETISYGELAYRLGSPKALRAVGGANGKNPIPIIVPCHRVIAAGGGLGGFSCGLPYKRKLLDLEASQTRPVQRSLYEAGGETLK